MSYLEPDALQTPSSEFPPTPNDVARVSGINDAAASPFEVVRSHHSIPKTQLLSCLVCHRRKVRCDRRTDGCESCLKTRAACVYPTAKVARKSVRNGRLSNTGESSKREQELEHKLKVLELQVQALTGAESTNVHERRGGSHASPEGAITTVASADGQSFQAESSRSNSAEQHNIDSTQLWISRVARDENIEDILQDLRVDDTSAQKRELEPYDPMSMSQQGFLFGYGSLMVNLHPLHPNRNQAIGYWRLYVKKVDPVTKILHVPSFERSFIDAHADLYRVEASQEALLFSVYYASITSLSPTQVQATFGESKEHLVQKYRFAIEQSLAKANFMKSKNLATLQALTIYLLCHLEDEDILWSMTGLLLRLAQRQGVHRDGTKFNLPPFEVEMRRRLWWQICTVDCRAAEIHGSMSSICEEDFDTEIPLNVDDSDIWPGMTGFPDSKTSTTDMSFCVAGVVITRTMCRINYRPLIGKDNDNCKGKTLEEKQQLFQECCQAIEACSSKHMSSQEPIDLVTVGFSRMMMSKMWLSMYHPPYRHSTENIPQEIKSKLLLVSLEVVCQSRPLESESKTQQWAWLFRSFVQWHAIAYLLAGLCQQQRHAFGQEFTTVAWKELDHVFGERYRDNGRNVKDGRLWLALKKLYNKAKALREVDAMNLTRATVEATVQHDLQHGTYSEIQLVGQDHENSGGALNTPSSSEDLTTFSHGGPRHSQPNIDPSSDWHQNQIGLQSDPNTFTTQQPSTTGNFNLLPDLSLNQTTASMFDLNNFAGETMPGVDWPEWDTIMHDFQFDIDGSVGEWTSDFAQNEIC